MKFQEIMKYVEELLSYDSVYNILKENEIDIVYDNDLVKGCDARIVSTQFGTCLFIRENLETYYEQFLILHEIGHYSLHKHVSMWLNSQRRLEHEANIFACLWLVKDDHTAVYYDRWLIDHGVPPVTAREFQDCMQQYKCSQHYGDSWLRMEC